MSGTSESPLLPFLDGRTDRARFSFAPPAPRELSEQPALLAGAVEVDITPPPGVPKAGYSRNAHTGTGFRTRLKARALHLRCGRSSLALVALDLLGGSSVLHHLVGQAIVERTDVPLAGLYLGATHTHGGPGQFLGTDFYNRFASNKPGFDPAFTQFLADQVADAVVEAVATRRPAQLAIGRAEVWGLTRNRSLAPHVRNPTVADRRTERQRAYVAINPDLHLLRVDATAPDGGTEPLGAFAVFSVHGTGIPMQSHHYNADLWAYVVGEATNRIERSHGARPVLGAVEGTHADVAPALRPGLAGHVEAGRIGCSIGARLADLYADLDGALSDRVELACGLREVDLDASRSIDGIELARRAAVGAALVAGAMENTTPVIDRLPPFRAGFPKPGASGPHGAKWVIGSRWLQPLIVPSASFPRVLPLQIVRVGGVLLAGFPFEVTVDSGRRAAAAVAAATADAGVERVIVGSVANEYCGYCTTPEEYDLQYYEGGHTIYGPNTQPFLAAHAVRLAVDALRHGVVSDVRPERAYDLRVKRFLPTPEGATAARTFEDGAAFADATATEDARWEQTWLDAAPGDLRWHERMVAVEACTREDQWEPVTDDDHWDVEVAHVGPAGPGHRYRVRWWNPSFTAGRPHRFVLVANGSRPEVAAPGFD